MKGTEKPLSRGERTRLYSRDITAWNMDQEVEAGFFYIKPSIQLSQIFARGDKGT